VLGGAIRGTLQRPDIRLVCGSREERAERSDRSQKAGRQNYPGD